MRGRGTVLDTLLVLLATGFFFAGITKRDTFLVAIAIYTAVWAQS